MARSRPPFASPPPPSPPRTTRAHPRRRARPSRRPTLRPTSSARDRRHRRRHLRALAVDADTSAGGRALEPTWLVTALGTNSVPATVHFASHCGAETFYEGGATLPVDVGPVRSAAAWDGDVALGTAQAPGVVVSGGALAPGVVTLRPGEDVLAAATAGPGPTFLFATWTAPSVVVKLRRTSAPGDSSDAARSRCRSGWTTSGPRRQGRTRPRDDAGLSSPRTRRRRWCLRSSSSTTSRSPPRRWRLKGASDNRGAGATEFRSRESVASPRLVLIQSSCARRRPGGASSYWITHTSPSKVVKMVHDGDATRQFGEAFELDAALGENAAASAVTDERGLLYVGFS